MLCINAIVQHNDDKLNNIDARHQAINIKASLLLGAARKRGWV